MDYKNILLKIMYFWWFNRTGAYSYIFYMAPIDVYIYFKRYVYCAYVYVNKSLEVSKHLPFD